jgi:tRNA nucleotidyltransferase (CCA-adding enzyme)
VEPQRLRAWLDELGIAGRDRDQVVAGAAGAEPLAAALAAARRPSEIAAAARGRPPEQVALAGALGPVAAARAWLDELRDVRLEITGDDLLAAGVPAGPEMGRRLDRALAARLDGEAVGSEAELAVALA